jgi:acyl-coenzyme A synthetase/AMP-(fatty) acid ligase/D-alanine-D-alanine ligase-like ATP-grasp enzyme
MEFSIGMLQMNVTDLISLHAKNRPNDLALITENERLDWFSFDSKLNAAMNVLAAEGVLPGQRIAISLRDQYLHLFFSLGLARLGATQIGLPPDDTVSTRAAVASKLDISSVIVENSYDGLDGLRGIEVTTKLLNKSPVIFDQTCSTAGDDTFLLLQSSGTTGNPKFSELTHKMAFERFERYKTYFETSPSDLFWPASRLDFVVAKQRVFHSLQAGAAVCIVSPRAIDANLLDFIDQSGVTLACGTPSHMVQILNASKSAISLPKLRVFEVRSATVSEALRHAFKDQISPGLFVAYATNEVEVACLADPELQTQVADTVGCPVAGMSVEVVDAEGARVPDGQAGIIKIAGKGVITQYLDDPVATTKSFKEGWFYPGDLGRFEGESLVFLGRSDDMMIFDGMNIYPTEIENALMLHPAVSEVAALPLKHPRFQDVPVAAVILKYSVVTEELHAHCNAILGIKSPRVIKILNKFPTNAMGKTLKREIRKCFEDEITSSAQTPSLSQNRLRFVGFEFLAPVQLNFIDLNDWLTLLDNEAQYRKLEQHSDGKSEGSAWLQFVLALSTSLLESLGIPIFEAPMVRSCLPNSSAEQKWKAICERPDPSLVPPKVFEGVLKAASNLATWCSTANPDSRSDRERFFQFIQTDVRRAFAKVMPRGKSTIEVLRVAHRLNIPYFPLPGGAFQVGMGSAGRRIDRSTTDQDSAIGARWTKSKTLTAQLLRQGGLPAPRHIAVNSVKQAKKASEHIGFPLVVKPSDLERGEGVTVDVQADNLEAACNEAVKRSPSKTALIEQQVAGVCHRLFVLDGKLLYAVRRLPIGVYANGRSTTKDLVNAESQAQHRLPPWKRSGIRPLDDLAIHMLRRQGLTADSVPEVGLFVALRRIETTAWGGVDEDVTNTIHPDNVKAAIEASKLFGLQVAGVDIISEDITHPWHSNGAIINEVNYAPLLGGGEISRSHIPTFLKTLIRDGGRIPIHVHFGGSEALAAAQEEWKQMVNSLLRVALVSSQQILLFDGRPYIMPLAGVYARCRALVLSPSIDALVLVIQDDEFLHSGLPFDSVTVVRDAGEELASYREKRPLDNEEANNLRRVLTSWV